jgi:hypothetical protein
MVFSCSAFLHPYQEVYMFEFNAKRMLSLAPVALAAMVSMAGVSVQAATSTDAKLSELLLKGATLTFGDKVFSNFVFSSESIFDPVNTGVELTVAQAAALIDVKAGLIGGNIGLDFMIDLQFSAAANSNAEFAHYQVSFSQAVPEPSTYALAMVGLMGMGAIACRRRLHG